jgi:hypothetical protein
MEYVEFEGVKIPVITVPKNTLLFRAVVHEEADYAGRDIGGRLCIPPNYNVFFYLTPYAIDSVKWYDKIKDVQVCRTTKDVKIVSLISPSEYTRNSRYDKQPFLLPCNSDKLKKACFKSRRADPCFRDSFLEEFPDIVGYSSLAKNDAEALMMSIQRGRLRGYKKYIPLVKDARGVEGTAEIVLYPLSKRRTESIYIEHPEAWKASQRFNYEHIETLNRNCEDRRAFMDKHAVLKDGMYIYKE